MRHALIGPTVAHNIRARRKELKMTCAELGRRTGLTRGGISAIELGRSAASVETVARIASALDLPLSDLFALAASNPRQHKGRSAVASG